MRHHLALLFTHNCAEHSLLGQYFVPYGSLSLGRAESESENENSASLNEHYDFSFWIQPKKCGLRMFLPGPKLLVLAECLPFHDCDFEYAFTRVAV